MRYVISQSHAFVLPENCAERESDSNRSCIRNINAAVECKVVTTAIRLRLDCDSTDVRLPLDCNSTVFFRPCNDHATTYTLRPYGATKYSANISNRRRCPTAWGLITRSRETASRHNDQRSDPVDLAKCCIRWESVRAGSAGNWRSWSR